MLQLRHAAHLAERLAAARRMVLGCRVDELDAMVATMRMELAGHGGAFPPNVEIEIAAMRASLRWNLEQFAAASSLLDQVSPLVPTAGGIAQARYHSLRSLIAIRTGASDEAVDEAALAVALVEDEPPSRDRARILGSCAQTFTQALLFPMAVLVNDDALATLDAIGEPKTPSHILGQHIQLTWGMRLDHLGLPQCAQRWAEAVDHHEKAMANAAALPDSTLALAGAERSLCAARMGEPVRAREFLTTAKAMRSGPMPTARRALAHAEGAVLLAEGRYSEARTVLRALWDSLDGTRVPARTEDVPLLIARTLEAEGRWDEALTWYREVYNRYGQAQYAVWESRATAARLQHEHTVLLQRTRQLESDALCDPLTGVANRRAFDVALPRLVADARQGHTLLTMVIVDVDCFKQVNDSHGHQVGDEVLRRVARVLREHARGIDRCARYGGDEFVLCLQANAEDAAVAAARITDAIARSDWSTVAPGLSVTVSTGLAELLRHDSPGTLFARADHGLLAAKRARQRPPAADTDTDTDDRLDPVGQL